jgi:hypothetical protein
MRLMVFQFVGFIFLTSSSQWARISCCAGVSALGKIGNEDDGKHRKQRLHFADGEDAFADHVENLEALFGCHVG